MNAPIRALTLVLACCVWGCATAPPAAPPQAKADATTTAIRQALDSGDTRALFDALRTEYAAHGLPVEDSLALELQELTDPISYYDAKRIAAVQTRLPRAGEGLTYWAQWSRTLTDGAWLPATAIGDERAQRRLGAYAVMGILTHELAHHLNHAYRAEGATPTLEELHADLLTTAMLNSLARDPALRELRDAYRRVVLGSLLDAMPATSKPQIAADERLEDVFATRLTTMPDTALGIVGLQLTRQRRMFDDPAAPTVAQLAARYHRGRAAEHEGRVLAPGWTLTTLARLGATPKLWRATRDDRSETHLAVQALSYRPDDGIIATPGGRVATVRRADGGTPASIARAFGLGDDSLLLVADGRALWVDGLAAEASPGVVERDDPLDVGIHKLGISPGGELGRMDFEGGARFSRLEAGDDGPYWRPLATLALTGSDDGPKDGPLSSATGRPRAFALTRDGAIVFLDATHSVRRIIGERVETLVGVGPGWRDGDGAEAAIQSVHRSGLAPGPRGSFAILDQRFEPAAESTLEAVTWARVVAPPAPATPAPVSCSDQALRPLFAPTEATWTARHPSGLRAELWAMDFDKGPPRVRTRGPALLATNGAADASDPSWVLLALVDGPAPDPSRPMTRIFATLHAQRVAFGQQPGAFWRFEGAPAEVCGDGSGSWHRTFTGRWCPPMTPCREAGPSVRVIHAHGRTVAVMAQGVTPAAVSQVVLPPTPP